MCHLLLDTLECFGTCVYIAELALCCLHSGYVSLRVLTQVHDLYFCPWIMGLMRLNTTRFTQSAWYSTLPCAHPGVGAVYNNCMYAPTLLWYNTVIFRVLHSETSAAIVMASLQKLVRFPARSLVIRQPPSRASHADLRNNIVFFRRALRQDRGTLLAFLVFIGIASSTAYMVRYIRVAIYVLCH